MTVIIYTGSTVSLHALLQMVIFFRDVTVSSRILFQIFLVIRFGRKEIPQRFELDSQRSAGFSLLPVIQTPELRVLSRIGEIDAGAVLDSPVIALSVHSNRIDDHKIVPDQLRKRQSRFVVDHPDRFRVSAAAAYILIGRRGLCRAFRPVGIAHLCRDHPVELVKKFLQAPDTAASQIYFLLQPVLSNDTAL